MGANQFVSFFAGSDLKTELKKLADQNKMTLSEFMKQHAELIASGKFSLNDKKIITPDQIGTVIQDMVEDIDKMTPEQAAKEYKKLLSSKGSDQKHSLYAGNVWTHELEEMYMTHEPAFNVALGSIRNLLLRCLMQRKQGGKAAQVLSADIMDHMKSGVSYVDKKERSLQKQSKRTEAVDRQYVKENADRIAKERKY